MTNQPEPDSDSTPEPPLRPRRRWLRAIAIAGGGLAVVGLGLGLWGYSFARRELPEFLQRNLSDALGRPIKVGEFERFRPSGVRLGPSIIPPTEDDFGWVRAQALEVDFNPLELLLTRTLRPSLIFVKPQVSIRQGFDGEWRIQPPQSVGTDGFFRTELHSVQIRNADLAIGPLSRTSIEELPEGVTSATLILLENVNLRLRFSGADNQTVSMIVGGRLNSGGFQVRGEGRLDTRQANLAVQTQQLPIESINPLLGGSLFVRNGLLSSNLDLKIRPEADEPLTVKGTARLRNGDIVLTSLPSALQEINGTMVLNGVGGSLQNSSLKFGPILVKAAGQIDVQKGHNLTIAIPKVSLAEVAEALAYPLPVEAAGQFRINTTVTGPLREPELAGELANLGPVQVDRLGIESIAAQFGATLDGATLHQATLRPATGGTVTAQRRVALGKSLRDAIQGRLDRGDRQNIYQAYQQTSPIAPDLTFTAQTDLPLDGIAALYGLALPPTWRLGPLLAEARLFGPPANLRGEADWQLSQSTFPGRGRVSYADRLVQARDTVFQVGGGTLRADATASLDNLGWQAAIAGSALGLSQVSPLLRGTLDTDLQASGSLAALTPSGIRAQGQARLSRAMPLAPGPWPGRLSEITLNLAALDEVLPGALSTRFAWTGQRLEILEATSPNLVARGSVDIRFGAGRSPQIGSVDLAARLSAIDLAAAYNVVNGPSWLHPRGTVNFDGTVRGTLNDPRLAGTVGLQQVGLNDFTLVEDVAGPVQASRATGTTVNLRGRNEEISASIAPDLRPNAFRLAIGEFLATGQRQGNRLDAEVQNFDLTALGLRPVPRPDLGTLAGLLNATATLNLENLANPAIAAQFDLDRPALGTIEGDRLTGQLQYRDGLALLTGGSFQLTPDTEFQIVGSGRLFPQWQGQAELTTAGANFQDLLQVLSLYSYADLGRLFSPLGLGNGLGTAADLTVTSVGDADASLAEQAELAQVLQEVNEERDRQRLNALLPALNQLDGQVAGTLSVNAAQSTDLAADFEFTGQNWAWGRYDFDNQFLARGRLRDRVISLDPVEFQAGDTRLSLLGNLSRQDSDLQVLAEQVPLTAAANLLEVPFEMTGLLSLNAKLTGPYTNPQLIGDFAVDGASVNQQPLQDISSTFQYENAYFNLDGRILGSSPEPLIFSGTVPYALPFMAVQPASDQIALRATLNDDALSLVNLFTPLLVWGGGTANIDVRIGGTLKQPLVSGLAAFNRATFNSPLLDASLADLTGEVQFQGTKIQVESLQGSLFDGAFELSGDLPLAPNYATPNDQGLRLALKDIDVNFVNEVRSRVSGYLTATNALLAPVIGGDLLLQESQVAVGPQLRALANTLVNNPKVGDLKASLSRVTEVVPVQFDNLRIALEPATIKAVPLFSFDMEGGLAISGPVPGLYGEGGVFLQRGWINTITAEFFLEPGRDNVVLFRPENKLDPYLDLILSASVPLQRNYNINRLNTTTGAAEIPDIDPLGSNTIFDELLIEARVKGLASRLVDNLELTSTPPYTENQLLGMVSGGYLSDLGGGEPTLALGSNLLGAFTADIQDAIGDALGLRRFRLGASTIAPSETGDSLGYGVGADVAITQNLSASLVQVLNQNQPLQFNTRYRIDDSWKLGGSSNLNDDHKVFVEYRVNFR